MIMIRIMIMIMVIIFHSFFYEESLPMVKSNYRNIEYRSQNTVVNMYKV